MPTMTERAERELRLAGLFNSDSDYGGMVGPAVMELFKTFAAQGHSGFSAGIVAGLFKTLVDGDTLMPITDAPADWVDVGEYGSKDAPPLWQNKRNFALMSNDGGKSYWHVDDRDDVMFSDPEARSL